MANMRSMSSLIAQRGILKDAAQTRAVSAIKQQISTICGKAKKYARCRSSVRDTP